MANVLEKSLFLFHSDHEPNLLSLVPSSQFVLVTYVFSVNRKFFSVLCSDQEVAHTCSDCRKKG